MQTCSLLRFQAYWNIFLKHSLWCCCLPKETNLQCRILISLCSDNHKQLTRYLPKKNSVHGDRRKKLQLSADTYWTQVSVRTSKTQCVLTWLRALQCADEELRRSWGLQLRSSSRCSRWNIAGTTKPCWAQTRQSGANQMSAMKIYLTKKKEKRVWQTIFTSVDKVLSCNARQERQSLQGKVCINTACVYNNHSQQNSCCTHTTFVACPFFWMEFTSTWLSGFSISHVKLTHFNTTFQYVTMQHFKRKKKMNRMRTCA